jgi:alpha-beta hydrolase superfamily lysophospholipase
MASLSASRGTSRTVNGLRGGITPVYPSGAIAPRAASRPPPAGSALAFGAASRPRPVGSALALDSRPRVPSPNPMPSLLRPRNLALAGLAAGAVSFGLAYRFALRYRARAGLPVRSPVSGSPKDHGLAYETVSIPCGQAGLAAWFVPAERPRGVAAAEPRPAVVIVHGWESNRGRAVAHARYLHAAGFHCLAIDARGHGDNPPETLPISVPEFAEDAAAAARWLAARPEVSGVGLLGHSMGAAGAIAAGASEPAVGAIVALSAPADPIRMTRQTFELAELHVPDVIATPLAALTAAVMLVPRRHSIEDASATVAAARYRGPLLLIHGEEDRGVPVGHLELIARAARATRGQGAAPVETMILPGFGHRWLFEAPETRRTIASFLARSLGGPVPPDEAGDLAAACVVERPENPVYGFGTAGAGLAAAAADRDQARVNARKRAGMAPASDSDEKPPAGKPPAGKPPA